MEVVTAFVETVKVALVEPAGTVTLAGTVATAVLPLDRVTTAPPAGAAPLNVTVPCDDPPPVTVDGFSVSEEAVIAGTTVSVAVGVAPP